MLNKKSDYLNELNPKQKLFCEYYCGKHKGNATQAAIEAGYSTKSVTTNTTKLLSNTNVQEYIKDISDKIEQKNISTIEDIQKFWSNVMNSNDEEMKNRLRASELLCKCKGGFINEW